VAIVWLVPLLAAGFAAWLTYDRLKDYGPEITVKFRDGSGVRVGQTPVRYRGVQIGEVTGVSLSEDQNAVEVKIRLQRGAASVAKEGAIFWISRPEVGIGGVSGLSTVITGPEILATPGKGGERTEFSGLDSAPAALELRGLKVIVRTARMGQSLQRSSPVYYRGVEVGVVQQVSLTYDASAVDVHVLIRERYRSLVRENSVFWNVSGVSVSGGIFKGVQMKMESLRSLAAGGLNFATPTDAGNAAKEGQLFALHAEGRAEWTSWKPRISVPEDKNEMLIVEEAKKTAAKAPAKKNER
jgi:paraquat-inducible protein B